MTVTSAEELRAALVGAWLLVSYESQAVDGSDVLYPLGTTPEGIIMYTPDGYMSAQLMAPGRGNYSDGDPHTANTDELAKAAAGYLSYSGPFTVEGTVVAHHVQTSLMPNWIGQTQYRAAQLDANTLTLRPTEPALMGGKLHNSTLVWRRP